MLRHVTVYLGSGGRERRIPSRRLSSRVAVVAVLFVVVSMPSVVVPADAGKDGDILFWTCSMHPQIRSDGPGKCPICAMDLIPVRKKSASEGSSPRRLLMSPEAVALASISTSTVRRRFIDVHLRLTGRLEYDPGLVQVVTATTAGRVDKLFVTYADVPVRKGDHLVWLYSPELIAAQAELIEALKRAAKGDDELFPSLLDSARNKLELLGLKRSQIAAVEKSGKVLNHLVIGSPFSGTVVKKHVDVGDYVKKGDVLFTVADLSRLWVRLDAYEADLPWLAYGQKVSFVTESDPGRRFEGTVFLVSSGLDPVTRTASVFVTVDNRKGDLKPGMFVTATVHARYAHVGRVMVPSLVGKWICPMHPDVVGSKGGACPYCGMDLVKSDTLGYTVMHSGGEPPLVVPASSVLLTGKRAVVYVRVKNSKQPAFEGREIVLGPRAGDYYIVKKGLKEGDEVVTKGSFFIDSELQILAKPSMMNVKR